MSRDKHNFAVPSALFALAVIAAFALKTTAIAQPPPGSLWYNGDFNGVGYHANGHNTSDPPDAVHDDFNVTGAWNVTAVFSDNLLNTVVTGADWTIRSGCAPGNGCTLVASGTTTTPTVTPTGRSGFGYTEYMVEVTGLNLNLPPGVYWLNVTPIGNGTGRSFNSTTSGANCVGTPCGNDGMSWFDSTGVVFSPNDFSMGVIGTVVPEPATVSLLACGLGVLPIALRRRRWRSGQVRSRLFWPEPFNHDGNWQALLKGSTSGAQPSWLWERQASCLSFHLASAGRMPAGPTAKMAVPLASLLGRRIR